MIKPYHRCLSLLVWSSTSTGMRGNCLFSNLWSVCIRIRIYGSDSRQTIIQFIERNNVWPYDRSCRGGGRKNSNTFLIERFLKYHFSYNNFLEVVRFIPGVRIGKTVLEKWGTTQGNHNQNYRLIPCIVVLRYFLSRWFSGNDGNKCVLQFDTVRR